MITRIGRDEASAIATWNRRATPAAPSAQPAAWIEAEPSASRAALIDVIQGICMSTRWHYQSEKPKTNNPVWPIYSAPVAAQPVAWRRPGPLGAQLRNSLDAVAPYDRHRWEPLYAASVAAQPIPEWISVKDRLPDDGALVVIFDPESDQEVWPAKWGAENNSFDSNGGWFEQDEVTHWMLLPPAPADKEE
jgi:hypothetical protein